MVRVMEEMAGVNPLAFPAKDSFKDAALVLANAGQGRIQRRLGEFNETACGPLP